MISSKLPLASREVAILRGHTGHVQCVRWNATGQYCLSGGNDRSIRLWNPEKGTLIKTYKGHSYEVLDIDVIGDNSQIVSVGEDKQPFLWDVTQGKIIRRYRGHGGRVHCVRFFSDTVFVTGSFDRTVKVWDLRSNNIDAVQSMDDAKDSVMSVVLTASEIIAGSTDGCIRRYDIRGGALVTDTIGAPVVSLSQSHDGNCIVVSTLDSTVRLFDKSNGELLSTYKGHANQKYKVDSVLTNSDAYVISGSEEGTVCFWDLVETTLVHRLKGHVGAVTGLATGPKDVNGVTPLLTSSTDGTVRYWT